MRPLCQLDSRLRRPRSPKDAVQLEVWRTFPGGAPESHHCLAQVRILKTNAWPEKAQMGHLRTP